MDRVVWESNITRENQHLFINNVQIPGCQNVAASFGVNAQNINYLGASQTLYLPVGPKIGNVSLNTVMVTTDPLLTYTGNIPITGYILRDKGNLYDNFSFDNGYLNSYSNNYTIGNLPSIEAGFSIYGDMGRFNADKLNENPIINTFPNYTSPEVLSNFHIGCTTVNLAMLNDNRLMAYQIGINTPRRPIYGVNKVTPVRVIQDYPLEVSINLAIEVNSYDYAGLRDFPTNDRAEDIAITIKNSEGSIINSYTFNDMILAGQSYNASADGVVTLNASYKKSIQKP